MNRQLCNVTKVSTQYQDRKILILDVWVELEHGGELSCFNIVLDRWCKEKERRVGTAYAAEMIISCLDFFGVNDLSEVRDYPCYILHTSEHIFSADDVTGLEQLPFKKFKNNRKSIIKKEILDEFKEM